MEKKRGEFGPLQRKNFIFVKNAERSLGSIALPATKKLRSTLTINIIPLGVLHIANVERKAIFMFSIENVVRK